VVAISSHFEQQVGVFKQADKLAEFEVFEDFTRIGRERLYVAFQVGFNVVLPHLARSIFEALKKESPLARSRNFSLASSGSELVLTPHISPQPRLWSPPTRTQGDAAA
jgi:hypothetical protein